MSTNESSSIGKIRKVASAILIVVFFALLCLPLLDSFLGLDKAPMPNEKRAPATFPSKPNKFEELQRFVSGVEAYYNDHFGFRKRLIRWHHRWKRNLFKESSMSEVMIGRDGWLFFAGDSMIEHARAVKPFSDEDLKQWKLLLEGRRDWAAKRGIRYLFVIPPDKHSVYPEYLPEWMTRVGKVTRVEQFMAYMGTNSNVELLDLRPPLVEAKKTARTYLYTDTHWNWYGAFIGYENLMHALAKQIPGLKPLDISAFEQKVQPVTPGGDLAGMLGQDTSLTEKEVVTFKAKPPLKDLEPIVQTNLLNKQWHRGAEPMITENPAASGKVIIFRDSFAGGFVPFLGLHFNKVIYLWQYNWDKEFITTEKPDLVIDEMLERFLNREDPAELRQKDEMRGVTSGSNQ